MALRFWLGTGGDALWSNINNWAATSGGTPGAAVPLSTDDVTFDSAGNNPCTLNTSFRVCKTLTVVTGYTNTITFTQQLRVSGSITLANDAYTLTGAGPLRMIAAGTWTTNGKTIPIPVEIGGTTTFTCTLADALTISSMLTLTNTTSTIFAGTFLITADDCTISGSQTITLVNDVQINNGTGISDACVLNGAFNWKTGGLVVNGALTGTATIFFNGSASWQGSAALSNNVVINTASGIAISGTVLYLAGTITYVAGTVSTTGSTLSIGSSCTLDTAGIVWNNIILTAALTLTINSLLTATGTLTLPNAAVTFAGSSGFTVGTLTNTTITATRIYTFTAARTYTVTTAFTTVSAAAQTVRFTFTAASSCNFILGPGATQDVGFLDPTNLNSASGQTIFTYHGTITTSPNWISTYRTNSPWQPPVYQLGG